MTAEPIQQIDYAAMARERMSALVREGIKMSDAALVVRDELLRSGAAWELFAQYGHLLVFEVWRARVKNEEPEIREPRPVGVTMLPPEDKFDILSTSEGVDDSMPAAFVAGELDQVTNLLDAPMRIDGLWTTLGSMGRAQCKAMQFYCEVEWAAFAIKAGLFKRLASELKDDERVRSRYTDKQLRALLAELGM